MIFEQFTFMPGTTIEAAIRLKNNYIHGPVLKKLVEKFNEQNGLQAPRVGQTYMIPVLENESEIII